MDDNYNASDDYNASDEKRFLSLVTILEKTLGKGKIDTVGYQMPSPSKSVVFKPMDFVEGKDKAREG